MTNKISIVTPVFNGKEYLAETIESIIFQKGNFELEYIIVDGSSTDNSLEIAESYKTLIETSPWLFKCKSLSITIISEKDEGMYDAINKGFKKSSGNICAYLNADDIYLPGALNTISEAFAEFEDVEWLKGITSYINKDTFLYKKGECFLYNREWIQQGIYGTNAYFIEQDSVFWRASLWKKMGHIDESLRLAGDFYMWVNFSKLAELYSLDTPISCFRKHEIQLSSDMQAYYSEVLKIQSSKLSWFTNIRTKYFFKCFYFFKCNICLDVFYWLLFSAQSNKVITVDEQSNFKRFKLHRFIKRY